MQTPLRITIRDLPPSAAIENHIREKAAKLEQFYPRIMGCRVVVETPGKHKHQGRLFNVRIDLTVPGGELVVGRDLNEDMYVALRDAFDAARRRLEDYGRRQRGEVKSHELASRGRVARLFPEAGYGFIEAHDGREIYFHRDKVVTPDFARLEVGTEVQFIEEMAGEGRQAKRVSAGKHSLSS